MTIYSEKTNKVYSTVDECLADEKAFDDKKAQEKAKKDKLAADRKVRAAEVTDAYKNYHEKLAAFIKDYGSFHMTMKAMDSPTSVFDFLDDVFS